MAPLSERRERLTAMGIDAGVAEELTEQDLQVLVRILAFGFCPAAALEELRRLSCRKYSKTWYSG